MQKNIDDIKQNLDEISQIIAKTVPVNYMRPLKEK